MRLHRSPHAVCAALCAVLGAMLPSAGQALTTPALPQERFVPNQVIVRFNPALPAAARTALDATRGASVVERLDAIDAELLHVPNVAAAMAALKNVPGVLSAEPNLIGSVAAAPPPSRANDPLVKGIGPNWDDRQWYLQRINALNAWSIWPGVYYSARERPTDAKRAIKVAVLDTWIDNEHRDWRNSGGASPSIRAGGQVDLNDATSFISPSRIGGNALWHGTFIAGLIGAAADNTVDIAGIAYSAQMMPVTVAGGDGSVYAWDMAKGISWAADHGARVINASFAVRGSSREVDALRAAVNRAVSKGSVLVAAIGNDAADDAEYPSGFSVENPGVIAVGASDRFDQRDVLCSKKGRQISLVAPDDLIWSLTPQNHSDGSSPATRRETCSTSFSTAIVSGVAALVASKYPTLSPSAIAARIEHGADDIPPAGRDDETGWGRVNAERALWPGGGPTTSWGTIPTGGAGRVQLTAGAYADAGVSEAKIMLDGVGYTSSSAYRARAADGRYGSKSESLSISVDTSKMSEGPHELAVRARDSKGKVGPASTSVLIVDRSPPSAQMGTCYSTNDAVGQNVANPDDGRQTVRFKIYDTWSRTLRVKLDMIDATLTSQVTFTFPALPSNLYQIPWRDIERKHGGPLTPGAYRIIVNVTDLAGLSNYSDTPCAVLPTTRIAPSPGSTQTSGPVPQVSARPPTATPKPTVPQTSSPAPGDTPATGLPTPTGTPTL